MNGTLTLKIFFSISLGLHLLFLSLSALLFPNFRVHPFPPLHIEVSLLPLIAETKTASDKIITHDSRLRAPSVEARLLRRTDETLDSVSPAKELVQQIDAQEPFTIHEQRGLLTIHEQRGLLRKEKKEDPVYPKEVVPEFSLPVRTDGRADVEVIPIHTPQTLVFEDEKLEIGRLKREKGPMGSLGNPFSSIGSSGQPKVAMKNPSFSESEVLFVQPKYDENPKPLYPQEARNKGLEGEVILRVEVLPNGRVGQIDLKQSSGYQLLDRSALTAVRGWRFIPAKKGEKAIPLWVNIPIKFQLQ